MSVMDNTENPKEYLGREKSCVQYIPMKLMLRLAEVHRSGAVKYGQKNWRVQPVRMSTYYNAMFRHMVEWFEGGEELDPESKEHHLLHVVACALIVLDAMEHDSIADDRAFAEVKTGKLAGSTTSADPPPEKSAGSTTSADPPPETPLAADEQAAVKTLIAAATTRRVISPDALARLEADARVNVRKLTGLVADDNGRNQGG